MFCPNCGAELDAGVKFCSNCGHQFQSEPPKTPERKRKPTAKKMIQEGQQITPNIVLCGDGKYRWIYEINLFKNLTFFFMVLKIFFFIALGILAFTLMIDLFSGDLDGERLLGNLKIMGYVMLGVVVLTILGYLLYAAIMGGKYVVMFEMDDSGINHKQISSQAKKAKKIGMLTSLAGLATGNMTTVGVGLTSQRSEMYTEFARVRKARSYPRRNLIKLNERLMHNQVYAASEDFAFVENYIMARIPQITK